MNLIKPLSILILSYIFVICSYENVILPIFSQEISINKISTLNNISSAYIYNNRDIYLWDSSKSNFFNSSYIEINKYQVYKAKVGNLEKIENLDFNIFHREYLLPNITWLDILIVFIFIQFIMTIGMLFTKGGDLKSMITGDENKYQLEKDIKLRLSDVVGIDEIKEEVVDIMDMMKYKYKFIKMKCKLLKGCLFTGKPGTGKTYLAKAIAGECNMNFVYVSGSDFNEMFVGLGASRVRNLFTFAKKHTPCIIFIDEIDALAHKRSDSSNFNNDKDNTLNSLLVELDGFKESDDLFVFGATNREDIIDHALMRSGRFDRKIHFGVPDANSRLELFKYYFPDEHFEDSKDEILTTVSNISYGMTPADVANIYSECCILSVKQNKKKMDLDLVIEAYEYVILGKEKSNYFLTEFELETVIRHELGHALLAYVLKHSTNPVQISIIPRGKSALGYTLRENKEIKLKTLNEMISEVMVMCGGRLAEEIYNGKYNISSGAYDDFKRASETVRTMLNDYNFFIDSHSLILEEDRYGDKMKNSLDMLSHQILLQIYQKGKEILLERKELLDKLIPELKEKKKLRKKEIDELFEGENEIDDFSIKLSVLNYEN